MKILFVVIIAAAGLLIIFGSPLTKEKPVRGYYYESPTPILPMTFAHADHPTENCIDCHHNYNDDTGYTQVSSPYPRNKKKNRQHLLQDDNPKPQTMIENDNTPVISSHNQLASLDDDDY